MWILYSCVGAFSMKKTTYEEIISTRENVLLWSAKSADKNAMKTAGKPFQFLQDSV